MNNWKDLPGIRERENKIKLIDLKLKKLKIQYLRSALIRHFPNEMRL